MEYYPRKIEEKLDQWIDRREVLIIRGPRQSGKTTLLLHLKEKYGGSYVTFEDEDMLSTFEEAPKEFIERFLKSGKEILFLDEAQYCGKVGKNLKLLFDLFSDKVKFIITGSGSFDIKVEVGKYLVGRAIYFELFPLTFEEFLLWKAKDLHKIFLEFKNQVKLFILNGKKIEVSPVFQREFSSLLEEYIIFGGFPAIVKEKDEKIKAELLKNLMRTYVEKDVFFFLNVREIEKFRKLLNYLSLTTGSLLELSSLMKEIGIDYKTLESYLSILLNTYIISFVSPFYRNLVTELRKAKKVYFIDTGLRNSLINNFLPLASRTDKGILFENFIFNELRGLGFDVKYWRTSGKSEMDFIIELQNQLIPVEVKSFGKIKRGFLSFINTYRPKSAIVFTENEFMIKRINDTNVAFLPHFLI
ncbi:MAG: ATP-binding protein [Nitrososphaeria archaeon]